MTLIKVLDTLGMKIIPSLHVLLFSLLISLCGTQYAEERKVSPNRDTSAISSESYTPKARKWPSCYDWVSPSILRKPLVACLKSKFGAFL